MASARETYVAAIQHDLVDPGTATPVGVVRDPTAWFHAAVDENESAQRAMTALCNRVRAGETVALVCFEGKRCHRTLLQDRLQRRLDERR